MVAEIRYRALRTGWIRAALGGVVGVVCLVMLGAGALLLTLDSVIGVLGAVMCLLVVLLSIATVLIGTRLQFTVDDDGLTLAHHLRTHRIPWEQVAVIEQSSTYWTTGQPDHGAGDHGSDGSVPRGEPLPRHRLLGPAALSRPGRHLSASALARELDAVDRRSSSHCCAKPHTWASAQRTRAS